LCLTERHSRNRDRSELKQNETTSNWFLNHHYLSQQTH
jgi:hypothetical protein